ncbi:hypothetical protein DNTS_006717 [Danionella cerebrum]|uniref:Pre-mRNA cleavage complex 2 protein Pcf11 n=1 Tax=Danionella cerebrum TaxID=2873325 RepID=A0A553RM75_9TELE|nr:hypothetical protein DNTS_006717 [Danionella translucida]
MSKPRALVSCTVLSVQDSCFLYPCCRSCLCKLKLDSNGAFCAKCGYTCGSHVDYRYRLSLKVSRNKDIFGATIFGGCLNPFFGIAAGDLQKFIKSEELDAAHTVQQLLVKAVEDCFIGKSVILELKVPQDFAKTSSLTGQLVAWQIISPHVFLMDCTVVTYFKALLQERSKSESTNQSKHIHAEELSSFDHTPPSCAMWDSQPSSEEFRISSIWRSPGLCFQMEESSHDSSQHPRDYGSKILCNRSQVQSLNYTQCELKEETPDSPRNVLYSSCDMFSSLAHCNVSTSGASTNMQRTLFCKKFFEITTSEKCLTDNALFHEMSLYSYSNPKISLNLEHSTISESVEKLGMFEHEESGILDKKGHNSEKTVEMMLDKHTCLWNDHAVPSYKAQVILCEFFGHRRQLNRLKMSGDSAREDACREYQSSLEDLTFNSKPHINMLTILAEENIQFTKDIVAIIEAQISKAPAVEKLPVLYLVDSIVKNVGGEYLEVFAKNLVNSFICVFEKVDENIRKSLFKLRSTWDEIFPLKKLYALDVRVNSLDPAWPIKPLPPNVNASIHVNPKFLKPTEETPPKPKPAPPPPTPSLSQEQMIRQQLLAKQKQLLELQQKKIELELEQTKAQLAVSPALALNHISGPVRQENTSKIPQTVPQQTKPWLAPPEKVSTRDPRLNRTGPTAVNTKEQPTHKKESQVTQSILNSAEKRGPISSERPLKFMRIPKKDNTATEDKSKSKSALPSGKSPLNRPRGIESERSKTGEVNKKDPRLHKQTHDRTDPKDELRDKKRSSDKKDDGLKNSDHQKLSSTRGKLVNGSLNKHEKPETFVKQEIKVNKANVRKRSRSRSRSPPGHSPKRKERRSSPKRKIRSISPPHKSGKARQGKHPHDDNFPSLSARDERSMKKSVIESRRSKRPLEDRPAEQKDGQPQRNSSAEHKDMKDGKRWRSGWEENKYPKQLEVDSSHGRLGQRHKIWSSNQKPPTPRTPKQHRLSASQRHANGEISNDEFLSVAHQINQIFLYQEERQRSDSWDESCDEGYPTRKKTQGEVTDAYLEHKSKLRRTQLLKPVAKEGQSPLREIHHYHPHNEQFGASSNVHKSSGDAIRPFSERGDPRRMERPPSGPGSTFRSSPNPGGFDGVCGKSPALPFAGMPSSSEMNEEPEGDITPRFESPNSVHSDTGPDDGPIMIEQLPRNDHFMEHGRGMQNNGQSPGNTPAHSSEGVMSQGPHHDDPNNSQQFDRFKGSQPPFDGPPSHLREPRLDGPSRPFPPRFDNTGGFDGPAQFPGHHFDAPQQFERFPNALERPVRFNNPPGPHRPTRFVEPHDVRFDPPPPIRYDHPMTHNRFVNPTRFENPHVEQVPTGYEEPQFPSRMNYDEQCPGRFENPPGGIRFENPVQFDQTPVMPIFNPQGPPRFCAPNIPQEPMMYDPTQSQAPIMNTVGPPPNFNMPLMNTFGHPMQGLTQQFPMQQNPQAPNFSLPGPMSSDFQGSFRPPFSAPGVGAVPQPEMGAQPFMPLNPINFHQDSTSTSLQLPLPEEEVEEEQEEDDDVPDMTAFVLDEMKTRHDSIITKLYTGIQCYSCGMRFTASQTDVYADHLDWHYRQNRSEKDFSKKVTHRRWYYGLTDWIEFEEIADLEERAKSQFFERVHEEVIQKTQEAAKEKEFQSVKAAADVVHELCEICQEQFEMYWEEEEEEWHLKNAIRTYHPSCFEDYQKTSSFVDATPSPNKLLTDNPLSAFLKEEPCDETSCSSIKEEPPEDNSEALMVKEEVQVKSEGESESSAIIF